MSNSFTIDQILKSIHDGYEGGHRLSFDEFSELYQRTSELLEDPVPHVTVVKLDSLLKVEFTDHGKYQVRVECENTLVARETLEKFIPKQALDFIDAVGKNEGFGAFVQAELRNHKRLLLLIVAVYCIVIGFWGNYEGLSNYFMATSQVVSVVVALLVVFTTVQQSWARRDPGLLEEGYLSTCHRIDKHLIALTVILSM